MLAICGREGESKGAYLGPERYNVFDNAARFSEVYSDALVRVIDKIIKFREELSHPLKFLYYHKVPYTVTKPRTVVSLLSKKLDLSAI